MATKRKQNKNKRASFAEWVQRMEDMDAWVDAWLQSPPNTPEKVSMYVIAEIVGAGLMRCREN